MDSTNFTNLQMDVNDSGDLIKNNFQLEESIEMESNKTFFTVVLILILLVVIIKKFLKKAENKVKKNSVLLIGPSNSGKTAFFYSLVLKNKEEKPETVTSMEMNEFHNLNSEVFNEEPLNLIDIPGQGFFKLKIMELLPAAKILIVFIDSSDKHNVTLAAEYIYDILNSDQFSENVPILIACNKQDTKFPKSKKIVEMELNGEIENIKNIKQKNNLDEDAAQIGSLFSMKGKFSFGMFKNIKFIECERSSNFKNLTQALKVINLEEIY